MGIAPHTLTKLEQDATEYKTTRSNLGKIFENLEWGDPKEGIDFEEIWAERTLATVVEGNALSTTSPDDLFHKPQTTAKEEQHPAKAIYQKIVAVPDNFECSQECEQGRQALRIIPTSITSLVGRQEEVRQIKARLLANRLVTLTGTGGIGKTRLAMEVKEQATSLYDIVCFVNLADLNDSRLVAVAVANALKVKEQLGQPMEDTLQEFLNTNTVLLILDNCEHLLAACASLTTVLLAGCRNLQILTTSREALGINGEVVWHVPSLSFPEPQHFSFDKTDATSFLLQYGALQLFVQRAQASEPSFLFTLHNAGLVAQICRRLDGIPLVIELAAARVKMLSLSEIMARLEDRFHLLTNGGRMTPHRHQTLRALIDWSYDLLNPQEQTLFCRLSVFEGGWTLEAAEEVGAGRGVKASEVLDLLTSLVDKNLVIVERKQEEQNTRYRLLETVHQYAQERLAAGKTVRRKHRDFFLKLAEDARPRLRGSNQAYWLAVLDEEHANLRQSLKFSLEEPEGGESSLRLAAALTEFWWTRGHLREGWEHTISALQHVGAQKHTRACADAFCCAGGLACMQGDFPGAILLLEEGLSIAREVGDKEVIAHVLNNLGSVVSNQGDYSRATLLLEESVRIARELEDGWSIANPLHNLGNVAYWQRDYASAYSLYNKSLAIRRKMGDQRNVAMALGSLGHVECEQKHYASARLLLEESLKMRRDLGDEPGISNVLNTLGNVAYQQGDYTTSQSFYEDNLKIVRKLGNKNWIALCLGSQAQMAYAQGDYTSAHSKLAEALKIFQATESKRSIMECLEEFASLAIKEEQADHCVQLWGTATALHEILECPLLPDERVKQEADLTAARKILGEEAFAVAWAQGHAMTIEEAIEYALNDVTV